MSTKISDLTVDELREIIRDVIEEYFDPDGELRPDFAAELKRRIKSEDWVEHEKVWDES